MRRFGFLLLLISIALKVVLSPFLYLYGVFSATCKKELDDWNKELAKANDQYGNSLGKYVFNKMLITQDSVHKFGNIDETISSVIGKNKKAGTLTRTGRWLDDLLEYVDNNHSLDAIDPTE